MRGSGDHWSIGERIAFYRGRRGLSQAQLAKLLGCSTDYVSKVERGERNIQRINILVYVADVLRISLGDLLGQPVLVENAEEPGNNVPAIRQALMTPARLSAVLFDLDEHPAPSPNHLSIATDRAWTDYQQGKLAATLEQLPHLITSAQALERHDELPRTRWATSSRIHHLASTALSKIGEADLSWIAAERAMHAADAADDPLVLASAARSGTHALLAGGRYNDAIDLGTRAEQWLHRRIHDADPAALSLAGALNLRMAIAAARRQDRTTATTLLERAESVADRLGHDDNQWHTAFGPANVRVHRISAALDLGDVPYATTHGETIDTTPLPNERRVSHLIDLARAHSYHGHDEHAAHLLLESGHIAPDLVRHNPAVRETTRTLWRRNPATLARQPTFLEFAVQCRATP